jgi:ATP-dependent RNA helicase DeaD
MPTGTPETSAAPSFAELDLGAPLLRALADVGYETPSPIQAATIPPLRAGRDLLGQAQTGTGKTAAFALPILARLDLAKTRPQALVLAPTRELAIQVAEAFQRYAAHLPGFHVLPIYGGQSYGPQLQGLRRGSHVVVGTPGRVIDHLKRGSLDLSELTTLVLDEADEMLRMGFIDDVEAVLAKTPPGRQIALFSATMPAQIRRISKKYLNDPAEVTVKNKTSTAPNVTHLYLMVSYPQKVDALTRILEVENFEGMIVFARTKNETETLAEKLRARGYSAIAINGDIAQNVRERTVNQLRDGKLDILVATDVAARGLDVERISHVVNYDIPTDTESYVHRIGRTGRAGRSGDAISFVTPRERYLLKAIERATKTTLTEMQLPSVEDINATRLGRFDDRITAALSSDELDTFRDVIAHYVREHNAPEGDVAAALAIVLQGDEPMLLGPDPVRPPRRERDADGPGGPRGRDRDDRGPRRDRDDRGPQGERGARRGASGPMSTYRIEVGRRHKVEPRQIVGALANEGGLGRQDFGHIDIRPDHSLVELPASLPEGTWERLRTTRISGQLIKLSESSERGGRPDKKPHRKGPRS